MNKWLDCIFGYVDKYFVVRSAVPTIHESVLHSFRDLVGFLYMTSGLVWSYHHSRYQVYLIYDSYAGSQKVQTRSHRGSRYSGKFNFPSSNEMMTFFIFRTRICFYTRPSLWSLIVMQVSRDRGGEPIDKDLLKGIADMCGELEVDCFEKDISLRMQMLSILEKHQNGLWRTTRSLCKTSIYFLFWFPVLLNSVRFNILYLIYI